VLYGPAVAEAYAIEKDVAKYSRLVIAPSAKPFLHDGVPILMDRDGIEFLDVLAGLKDCNQNRRWLSRCIKRAERNLTRTHGLLDLWQKHGWFFGYLCRKAAKWGADGEDVLGPSRKRRSRPMTRREVLLRMQKPNNWRGVRRSKRSDVSPMKGNRRMVDLIARTLEPPRRRSLGL
jgi:hypothetical protein